jgi:hypothetical protein
MNFQTFNSKFASKLSVSLLTLAFVCFGLLLDSATAQRSKTERTGNSGGNAAPDSGAQNKATNKTQNRTQTKPQNNRTVNSGQQGQGGNTDGGMVYDRQANTNQGQRTQQSVTAGNGTVPKPTGKNLSDTQKNNIKNLTEDLSDIKAGSTITQDQVKDLGNSLMTLAEGTTRPDPKTVDKLAGDIADVISDGGISQSDINLIMEDIAAVMNSANIPQAEVDAVIANAQTILKASGVDAGDLKEIKWDLEQIAKELKGNVNKAKSKLSTYRKS